MLIGLHHYLIVAAILFTIGVFGIFVNRKNVIIILMCVELILLAVNINFVAFSAHMKPVAGARVSFVIYLLIVFGPLIGAMIAGLAGTRFGPQFLNSTASKVVTTGLLFLSAILSWIVFINIGFGEAQDKTVELFRWMDVGALSASWALKIDTLTAVMLVVVNTVSALVHLYSWGYMEDDEYQPRFFAYLSLFTFAMLMLVTSDNFIQLFFGWEGVGLASYLLIGYYYKKPTANAAAIKAFVTNRVGDVGLALGIMTIFLIFGSVNFDDVFRDVKTHADTVVSFLGFEFNVIELIALCAYPCRDYGDRRRFSCLPRLSDL